MNDHDVLFYTLICISCSTRKSYQTEFVYDPASTNYSSKKREVNAGKKHSKWFVESLAGFNINHGQTREPIRKDDGPLTNVYRRRGKRDKVGMKNGPGNNNGLCVYERRKKENECKRRRRAF